MPETTMQQPAWMAAAWAELGQAERPGAASNSRILDYFRAAGHAEIADDETAWCAAFVGACLERAGVVSTRSLMARSYLAWGTATKAPSVGTVVVLSRGDDPALGHVGFLVGETSTHLILLGGNQSNAVTVAAFDRARVLGFRAPPVPDPHPADGASRTFDMALVHVLSLEGGWSDDPFDPGGPTNKGITLADLAREKRITVTAGNFAALKAELRSIPDALVRDIYLNRTWRPAHCADLPPALALMHFDAAVNQGVTGAARMLQEVLGVEIDGEIGPVTLAAARACLLTQALETYAAIRRRRYRSLAQFWRFGRGWLNRVDATLARALALARDGNATPSPASTPSTQETAAMPDGESNFPPATSSNDDAADSTPDSKWWGQSMTIWGALLTALSTVLPLIGPALGIDLTADLIQKLGQDIVVFVQAAGGLIGTILTILGRVRATTALTRKPLSLKL